MSDIETTLTEALAELRRSRSPHTTIITLALDEVRRLRAENADLWERANRYATIAGDWRNFAVGSSKERPTAPMPVKLPARE